MTEQPIEQRTNPPTRFLRRPEVTARTGLSRSTIKVRMRRGVLSPAGIAGLARRGLDRGGGGRVDPQADRVEPRRGRVIGASQRETKENTMQSFLRTVRAAAWATLWLLFPRAAVGRRGRARGWRR